MTTPIYREHEFSYAGGATKSNSTKLQRVKVREYMCMSCIYYMLHVFVHVHLERSSH